MDIEFSPAEERFRLEVREFFNTEFPRDIIEKLQNGQQLTREDRIRSEAALHAKGWIAVNWPREYGGTGWTASQKHIFEEELERAGAPNVMPFGLLYVAPVIYTFGNEEQKRRWLPDILAARTLWAQGYSEPDSGSDLASLRTRAERQGDHYIVNGVKTWTSSGHWADWIFCLVRTSDDPVKQKGISFLCMDMKTPGITVRPIISIDGEHHLNQVIFENVRVPVENLIGEENEGWSYAKYLLTHERTSYAHIGGKKKDIAKLKDLARAHRIGNHTLMDEPGFAAKIAKVELELMALEYTALRALASVSAGGAPGNESSALKVLATENAQAITELYLEMSGMFMAPLVPERHDAGWADALGNVPAYAVSSTASYFIARAQTIYGGTTEVQKNVMAKAVLGLP